MLGLSHLGLQATSPFSNDLYELDMFHLSPYTRDWSTLSNIRGGQRLETQHTDNLELSHILDLVRGGHD